MSTESTEPRSLRAVLEAVLFSSSRPVSSVEIVDVLRAAAAAEDAAADHGGRTEEEVEETFRDLAAACRDERRGFQLEQIRGGWQIVSDPDLSPWVRAFLDEGRPQRLSRPALETLAIVAYRQPLTRAEVEAIRGVNADGVLSMLLERGLVRIAGRSEAPGRPFLYGTSEEFLEHFRLQSLEELPDGDQLRRAAGEMARRVAEQDEKTRSGSPNETETTPVLPFPGQDGDDDPATMAGEPEQSAAGADAPSDPAAGSGADQATAGSDDMGDPQDAGGPDEER